MIEMRRDNQALAVRRCTAYRKGFRGAVLNFPARVLRSEPVGEWIRRKRVGVDVATVRDWGQAVAAEVQPARVVASCAEASVLREAASAGVGRFVVDDGAQLEALAECVRGTPRVLIDVTGPSPRALLGQAMAHEQLDVIGLYRRLEVAGSGPARDALWEMFGQMAWVRRRYGVILTRACLSGFDCPTGRPDLRRSWAELESTVDDACAWYRYPRPALVLSLHGAAILS